METSRRLDRARHQYENLLIYAGDVLVEHPLQWQAKQNSNNQNGMTTYEYMDNVNNNYEDVQSIDISEDELLFSSIPISDKDSIIVALQEEIDKNTNNIKKIKLKHDEETEILCKAKDLLQDGFQNEINAANRRNEELFQENNQLRDMLNQLQLELKEERNVLHKSLQAIQRLTSRDRITSNDQRNFQQSAASIL